MAYIILRYIHLLAVLILIGGILIENAAAKPSISGEDARNLARVDATCGISMLLLLIVGLILWFGVGKPPDFYTVNPVFHAKLTLVIALLITAIRPALFFIKHRQSEAEQLTVPKSVLLCLRIEIGFILLIPILAWLMARGVGIPG